VNAQGAQWDCKYIPVNAEGLYCLWRWTKSPAGLSWCMCVCVRGVKEDLEILYAIFDIVSCI